MENRREAMKAMGMTVIASMCDVIPKMATAQATQTTGGTPAAPYTVPPLTYEYDALEPYIDAQTMHLHHDKHHAAYVKNLNAALADHPDLAKQPVAELVKHLDRVPEAIRTAVRNNGGGHANHSFFWQAMQKNTPGQPKAELAKAIDSRFGSFSTFQEQFTKAALSVFGSGWAWLSLDDKKQLIIETTPNQDSPWMAGRIPVLGIDVWEHAYYLKYQNVRVDYIAAFYKVISWDFAAEQFKNALRSA
jgi:Fe-Mn family superoxide dismutase